MTILQVVKDVCAVVGVVVPNTVFGNITANRTMQEMVTLANEMAQRIATDTRDWTRMKALHSFIGDGITTAWDLPNNYRRLLLTTNVWSSVTTHAPLRFFPDADMWVRRRKDNRTDGSGEWTLIGGQMHIFPVLPPGAVASFVYLSKHCVALAGAGGYSDTFLSDGDTFVLDERLLKLGMTWQWKANKGSPYAEDMGTYSDALTTALGSDSPAPILSNYPHVAGGWHANF
jgi:hypothetical protein